MTEDFLAQFLAEEAASGCLSPTERQLLLDKVEELGNVDDACAVCHLTASRLMEAVEADATLDQDLVMAGGRFKAELRRRITDLALNGYQVPIIGGQHKDTVVAEHTMPDPAALKIVASMHFSKDMAQYTRAEVKTQDVSKKPADDRLNVDNLKREERTELSRLLHKASGDKVLLEAAAKHMEKTGNG